MFKQKFILLCLLCTIFCSLLQTANTSEAAAASLNSYPYYTAKAVRFNFADSQIITDSLQVVGSASNSVAPIDDNRKDVDTHAIGNALPVIGGVLDSLPNTSSNKSEISTPVTNTVSSEPVTTSANAQSVPAPKPKLPPVYQVGVINQEEPTNYLSSNQFWTWYGSDCSAASITSILVGYGVPVKLGNVLQTMINAGMISSWAGADNNAFIPVAQAYGFHADENRDPNLESHFNWIYKQLQAHKPVIMDLHGPYYWGGHFVVAYQLDNDGTIKIMNPDWYGKTPPGLQTWKISDLKSYYDGFKLSVVFEK